MNGSQVIKCRICGEPYRVYNMTVADQSACPDCIRKADAKMPQRYVMPYWVEQNLPTTKDKL